MPLREQTGNMYPFITHTWNPIKGKCSFDCVYCFMKRFKQNPIRLDKKELTEGLGSGNFIFVGSGTDIFADDVPMSWIEEVFHHIYMNRDIGAAPNRFLFQSKNPERMKQWAHRADSTLDVFGTTIETNRPFHSGNAPGVIERAFHLQALRQNGYSTMVTIEPVLDFDLGELVTLIRLISPQWVNIGADSKGHQLPEPDAGKLRELIERMELITEVKVKTNLSRILGISRVLGS